MILPQTYTGTLLLMILGLLCLGSWANLYKLAGKWRFELFYFDFAIGLMLAAAIAAFTLGSLGYDGFKLTDDLIHAGRRQIMWALAAGLVFNLGNMLLVAAVSAAGMAVAFPVGMGLALVITVLIGAVNGTGVNSKLLVWGALLVLAAVVADAWVYGSVMKIRRAAVAPVAGKRPGRRGPGPLKGLILAAAAGSLIALMYIPLAHATVPEVGLGPFSLTLLFAFATALSTFVYNIFFMNLPVEGEPLELIDYFKAKPKMHLFGLAAGVLWCAGMLANWTAGTVEAEAQPGRGLSLALSQGSILLALVWGLAAWKEFRGVTGTAKVVTFLMAILLGCGLALLALGVSGPAKA